MAFSFAYGWSLAAGLTVLAIGGGTWPSTAQRPPQAQTGPSASDGPDTSLSPECRVPGSLLYTLAPLKAVRAALDQQRPVKVLALGSTGSDAGAASYALRLEDDLERLLGAGVDVQVEQRGLAGEITAGAIERITRLVAEIEPDLVVWQQPSTKMVNSAARGGTHETVH